ncbi:shikimate kinase AroK [Candidatus Venteria ishoeyi]|nr:shikimate kinase AroK [Candidatus Venteria ishoeyi]MDM8545350.1 shikimate kinase AroK [Candidatus Venteria ishoeyi]
MSYFDNLPAGNLFLIGPMGVGKTTIGRQLAQELGREFKDSDREIEERTGADIPLIFELEGEIGFRRREREVIDELSQLSNIVIATGGGSVLDPDNQQCLKTRGTVIYLYASLDQLVKRTNRNKGRPLLQTDNPREKLESIMREREPIYQNLADISMETGQDSIRHVVQVLLSKLEQ